MSLLSSFLELVSAVQGVRLPFFSPRSFGSSRRVVCSRMLESAFLHCQTWDASVLEAVALERKKALGVLIYSVV